ncbi:MAG: hypothetical protein VXX96_02300 [Bacteroidota bacterium]|nr:hypothetical protein [Bacteroidota bacterium]MEC8175532.1 hypothetical protein [Bacteroidota bacterium]MEC8367536.1 hypothetical protein [Bacteroidota bacterium]MEC8602013.1 hypothetical protein [Bacteroidota bacterium]|tara:strand:- start:2320 stop:2526 length:207 start_codon:yes stop_codon:yes gene_type:complete
MKKYLLMILITGFYSCVDIKPDIKVEQIIDLKIDGENVDGLEGEWVITTDEDNDVITIKIEKKEEEIQ